MFADQLPAEWVHNHVDPQLLVAANDVRLEQVFVNLISNSVDAIQTRLTITSAPPPMINITTTAAENTIEIHIKDNGCGMTKDQINQIFEPFFTTKEVGKGLGLGMSITHNIVHDFNGSIHVDSSLNNGTEVTLCLKPM